MSLGPFCITFLTGIIFLLYIELQFISGGLGADALAEQMKLILVVSLGKVAESMSQFTSPYLKQILLALCQFDVHNNSDLSVRVNKVVDTIAMTSPRLLLPAISDIYSGLEDNKICTLLYIVEKHIDKAR